MEPLLECPQCHAVAMDLHDYESMIVVTTRYALFGLRCPCCGTRASSMHPIPPDMQDEVLYAAVEVGAGMGLTD